MKIEVIVDKYIASDNIERLKIKNDIGQSNQHLGDLLGFITECTRQTVRQKSKNILIKGLYAITLEDCKQDFRDQIIALTLLYHGAIIIGMDPDKEFKKVAEDTEGEGRKLIISFINRKPEDKTLKCMGYRTIITPEFDFMFDGLNTKYILGNEYTEQSDKIILNNANT